MIRIQGVPPAVRQALIDVEKRLNRLEQGDLDLRGRRVRGGRGVRGTDFVTRRQLDDVAAPRRSQDSIWRRTGPVIHPIILDDRLGLGLLAFPTATVRLHIRNSAVASFPTLAAVDFLVIENNGNTNLALVVGATSDARIRFYGSGDAAMEGEIRYNRNTRALSFAAASTARVQITSAGSLLTQLAGALTTTATDGFIYIPTCAGTPTGVPTAQAGMVPMVYDTTNHVLYVYSGGVWRTH